MELARRASEAGRCRADRDDFRKHHDPSQVRVLRLTLLTAWLSPWGERPRFGLG
jgi:hypothetical protein